MISRVKNRFVGLVALVAIASVATSAVSCKKADPKAQADKAGGGKRGGRGGGAGVKFPVDIYPVSSKHVDYIVTAPGTVDAFEHVQVTARVQGAVDKVGFSEGQNVKKGDVLVVIDAERFASTVASAQAAVAKAEAEQADVEASIKRREGASADHPGLIPGEELATYQTKGLTAKADTAVAREQLHAAQINLRDATVRAPMDGIIQTRTVETGQYINSGYVMATLLQSKPMLLRFQVSPLEAPRIKPGVEAQFKLRETLRTFTAKVTLVAGAADEASRLVPITAEIVDDNHGFWLRPGSFADVTLNLGGTRDAIVIPRSATRATERGFVAYVVDGEIAHERVLQLGQNTSDGFVEVRDGLKAGDKLVLRGGEPLAEGTGVVPTEVPPPTAADLAAPPSPGGPTTPGTPESNLPPESSAQPAGSAAPDASGEPKHKRRGGDKGTAQ